MKELIAEGDTLPNAYHKALELLQTFGERSPCPDWKTTQWECSMTIHIHNPLKEPMISKLFIGGAKELEQYTQEILDGILDFEVDEGKWQYTYHRRMTDYPCVDNDNVIKIKNQYEFVINELRRNPSSRRAVIVIRDVGIDAGSTDPACLQHIQYFIRNGKLDCKVLFRSNDACKATFMNAFALIKLQEKIARELGTDIGTYTHRANSFHCYEKDIPMLEGYCFQICESDDEDLTYNYIGDWREWMDEYKPEIAKIIKALKNRSALNLAQI